MPEATPLGLPTGRIKMKVRDIIKIVKRMAGGSSALLAVIASMGIWRSLAP